MACALYVIGKKKSILEKIKRPSSYASSRTKKDAKGTRKIDEWLNKQNLGLHAREFLVLLLIIGTLPMLVGFLFRLPPVLCLGLSMAGVSFFFIWVRFKNNKDNAKKEEQMEQFLLDLNANLYSNPNVINCIIKAAQQIDHPLKREFEMVIDENRRGVLLNDCLRHMIQRNNSPLIETVLLGFMAANDKGADLIRFLDSQIAYMREKRSLRNYIHILSSGPRYTSYLIMLIPVASIFVLSLINRNFIQILFSDIGFAVMAYAAISYLAGIFLINKIVNIHEKRRH